MAWRNTFKAQAEATKHSQAQSEDKYFPTVRDHSRQQALGTARVPKFSSTLEKVNARSPKECHSI